MVVFNLLAIPVVIVIFLIGVGLSWIFPLLGDGSPAHLMYGLIAVIVGGLTDLVGLKGRIFWLPIWLLGLGLTGYGAWGLLGIFGLIGGAIVIGLGLVGFFIFGAKASKDMEAEAPARLEEARAAAVAGDLETFWELIASAYVPPAVGKLTPPVAQHLDNVLDLLLQGQAHLGLSRGHVDLITAASMICRDVIGGVKAQGFFSAEAGLVSSVETLIRERGQWIPPQNTIEDLEKFMANRASWT